MQDMTSGKHPASLVLHTPSGVLPLARLKNPGALCDSRRIQQPKSKEMGRTRIPGASRLVLDDEVICL